MYVWTNKSSRMWVTPCSGVEIARAWCVSQGAASTAAFNRSCPEWIRIQCLVGIIRCVGKAGSRVIPLSLIKMSRWFWSITVINIWWIKAGGIGAKDRQIVMQWDTKMPQRYLIHRSPLLSQQRSELLDWGESLWRMFCWHDITQPKWCSRASVMQAA